MKHRGNRKNTCIHCKNVKPDVEGEWHELDHMPRWVCYVCWADFVGPINIDPRRIISQEKENG